jgi:excisionase family DNA binding protein
MAVKELLDIRDLSALTGFSPGTLYHWISEGKIPFVRFSSRCVRFRRSDIDTWIEGKLVAPKSTDLPLRCGQATESRRAIKPRTKENAA